MKSSAPAPLVRSARAALRVLGYVWTSPNTLLGLLLAPLALLQDGHASVVDGVLELGGRPFARLLNLSTGLAGGAAAMTLGHVVIGRDRSALDATRVHERVHVNQYAWLGPLFLPLYLVCGGLCLLRRQHPYRDNPFERAAYAHEQRVAQERRA